MKATLQKTENGYGLKEMVAFVSSVRPEHKHYKLSLKNCQAIENGYDLDELAHEYIQTIYDFRKDVEYLNSKSYDFIAGFQKALEMFGDKKFSEKDIKKAIQSAINSCSVKRVINRYVPDELLDEVECNLSEEDIIQELQQTEWNVEVEMENDTNQCDGCKAGHELNDLGMHIYPNSTRAYMVCQANKYKKPKLDKDDCLILKRI